MITVFYNIALMKRVISKIRCKMIIVNLFKRRKFKPTANRTCIESDKPAIVGLRCSI